MSMNFGYGNYGMMGMNQMNMMGMQQNSGQHGNVFKEMKEQYGCGDCYRFGPVPPDMQVHVMPLPPEATKTSLWSKLTYYLLGS